MKRLGIVLICLVWMAPLWAASNVLFILDASGSMAARMGGEVKMDAAKKAFHALLSGLPQEVNAGLEVYGHYGNKDCSAIEVMNPVAPLDAEGISSNVNKLEPLRGATPMAAALEKGAEVLSSSEGDRTIVLISDGRETCGGDPAAVAARLRKEGLNIVTHVVGLGVNEEEKAQLAAIAKAGGGQYYAANSADELKASLAAIRKKVVRLEALFRDDFDGEMIGDEWELINPDADNAIVEEGMLQIVTQVPEKKLFNAKNLLLYRGTLPKEYEVEARVITSLAPSSSCQVQGVNSPFAGVVLKQDDDNAILLMSGRSLGTCESGHAVAFLRLKNGKWQPGFWKVLGSPGLNRAVRLKLRRMQRKFVGSYSVDDGKTWQDLGVFTSLRPRFRLGIIAARGNGGTHPMLERFDWIELRDLKR